MLTSRRLHLSGQRLDADAAVATVAPDAYVNDARREINGIDAIRRWVSKE